eukprot:243327_1
MGVLLATASFLVLCLPGLRGHDWGGLEAAFLEFEKTATLTGTHPPAHLTVKITSGLGSLRPISCEGDGATASSSLGTGQNHHHGALCCATGSDALALGFLHPTWRLHFVPAGWFLPNLTWPAAQLSPFPSADLLEPFNNDLSAFAAAVSPHAPQEVEDFKASVEAQGKIEGFAIGPVRCDGCSEHDEGPHGPCAYWKGAREACLAAAEASGGNGKDGNGDEGGADEGDNHGHEEQPRSPRAPEPECFGTGISYLQAVGVCTSIGAAPCTLDQISMAAAKWNVGDGQGEEEENGQGQGPQDDGHHRQAAQRRLRSNDGDEEGSDGEQPNHPTPSLPARCKRAWTATPCDERTCWAGEGGHQHQDNDNEKADG